MILVAHKCARMCKSAKEVNVENFMEDWAKIAVRKKYMDYVFHQE